MKKYFIITSFLSLIVVSACSSKSGDNAKLFYISDYAEPGKASFPQDFKEEETSFTDIRTQDFAPTIERNGFTFADFRNDDHKEFITTLSDVNKSLKQGVEDKPLLKSLNDLTESAMGDFVRKNLPSLQFNKVICTLRVYRSSNPSGGGHRNYPIAHMDFAEGYYTKIHLLLEAFERKSLFSSRLGIDSLNEAYWQDPKRLALLLNVWMPLNDVVKNHHLGLVDKDTINRAEDIINYPTMIPDQENNNQNRGFYTVGLKYRPDRHRWYYKSDMEFGEAIIFDTKNTAHASISPPEPEFERRSIETRCFFINI